MYLHYLRTKFKTLAMVSTPLAGKKAFDLFCTPYPKYKKRKEPTIFHQAQPISLTLLNGIKINGFEWTPSNSNSKTILIVHGFASCGFKFEHYITPLLKMGYRVLVFDAPGHGLSEGTYINIVIYVNAIEQIIQKFGTIDDFIGHSLGAITLSMIAEKMPNPEKHRFVLIAPATKTTTTFNNYFKMMHFSPALKEAFMQVLLKRTHFPITHFEADRAIENYQGPILWVHDQDDKVCPYKDLIKFQQNAPTNIKFLITKGLGHNKVYKNQGVMDKIMAFLAV